MPDPVDPAAWSCPVPLRHHDRVVIGHGGGGRLTAELVEHLFLPAFGAGPDTELHDAVTLEVGAGRIAMSTDAYVVRPLFFPGGSIGELAVNGTVNDIAMAGANPLALTASFVLEEGLPLETLGRVADSMGAAARAARVPIAAGDTKVVEAGQADGMYVTTAGIGVVPEEVDVRPRRATAGDVIVLSGPIGMHGIAVLSQREGLEFGTDLRSDSAPLAGLVAAMLGAHRDLHVLRDCTRGGVTASLCEIAAAAGVGVEYEESAVPVPADVAAACSLLGLDPMSVANEGKLVAFVPPGAVDDVVGAMHAHEHGRDACVIGRVTDRHPGVVVCRTPFGASRVVDLPLGEQLPRIC